MTPASLQKNYKTQMKFCGDQLFKEKNYWVEISIPRDNSTESKKLIKSIISLTGFSLRELRKLKRVYLVDKDREEPNFDTFPRSKQIEISKQIELLISKKFHFINYNGITEKKWLSTYQRNQSMNPFNRSVIVIDEGHNFVSRIINKLNAKQTSVSTMIYEAIMSADDCNVVVLSGTPMINYPSELGTLFNLIGGYNYCIFVEIRSKAGSKVSKPAIQKIFQDHNNVDFIDFTNHPTIFRITRNPYGFIKRDNKLIFDPERGNVSLFNFKQDIEGTLKTYGYTIVKCEIEKFKKFPDTKKDFDEIFVDKEGNFDKKVYFQTKILGMVSYLGDKKELMPNMILPADYEERKEAIFMENMKMNEYVLSQYSAAREIERKIDMRKHNQNEQSSSYRIFSRAACNFVFPESIPRPRLQKKLR